MTLSIIAAISTNGVIGRDGHIPWNLPRDANRFRAMVAGHPLIMGAGTWRSHKVKFPNAIVVSSTMGEQDRAVVVPSVDEALRAVPTVGAKHEGTFVLGGHDIFKALLPRVDRMYLTFVHTVIEGTSRFPLYDAREWVVVDRTDWLADRANEYNYSFIEMVRKP